MTATSQFASAQTVANRSLFLSLVIAIWGMAQSATNPGAEAADKTSRTFTQLINNLSIQPNHTPRHKSADMRVVWFLTKLAHPSFDFYTRAHGPAFSSP